MCRLAIVAALVAGCGDGRTVESDAAVESDASDRGVVRVKVTGFVEKAGLRVLFQERDSSLSLSTRTDANGEATGRLAPDGFVTLVAGFDATLTMWTYTGVQPGDVLEFHEPDVVNVETPIRSVSVFAPNAGSPPFTLRSSCGGAQTIFDALPVAMPISVCAPRVDFLLEYGQVYRYARDVNIDVQVPRIDFANEFVEYDLSTVTVTGVQGTQGVVQQSLIGQGRSLATTNNFASVIGDELRVMLGLPLPAGATMLTQVEIFDDPLAHRIADWRPSSTSLALAYDAIDLARATQAPRYDASTTSIVWSEDSGTPGDLARATLHWLDDLHARTRSWVIIGPRGAEPVLRLPLIPVTDLVPLVDAPQTMQSFLAGDALPWTRTHLHGRWLPDGVDWPAHGEAGRVVWRSF